MIKRTPIIDINTGKVIENLKKKAFIKAGDYVEGNLLPKPCKVLAVGIYAYVEDYDDSGAMQESIDEGHSSPFETCVAVEFPGEYGGTGVYPIREVYRVRKHD